MTDELTKAREKLSFGETCKCAVRSHWRTVPRAFPRAVAHTSRPGAQPITKRVRVAAAKRFAPSELQRHLDRERSLRRASRRSKNLSREIDIVRKVLLRLSLQVHQYSARTVRIALTTRASFPCDSAGRLINMPRGMSASLSPLSMDCTAPGPRDNLGRPRKAGTAPSAQ